MTQKSLALAFAGAYHELKLLRSQERNLTVHPHAAGQQLRFLKLDPHDVWYVFVMHRDLRIICSFSDVDFSMID